MEKISRQETVVQRFWRQANSIRGDGASANPTIRLDVAQNAVQDLEKRLDEARATHTTGMPNPLDMQRMVDDLKERVSRLEGEGKAIELEYPDPEAATHYSMALAALRNRSVAAAEAISQLPRRSGMPMAQYLLEGTYPGQPVHAVIEGNLLEFLELGKESEAEWLGQWAKVLLAIPILSWGSAEQVRKWHASGGFRGQRQAQEDARRHHQEKR